MKKLLFLLVLLPLVAVSQTNTENWVKTTTYKVPTSTVTTPSAAQKSINVTYFDGLGRPIQQLANQQSGSGKNIVTHIEYDAFGRQVKDFLPYSTTGTGLDFVSSASTDVGTFYYRPMYQNTTNPYSEKLLEASPLNRILEQAAPGADWGLAAATKHTIRLDYQTNFGEEVKLFVATTSWDTTSSLYEPALTQTSNYASNELYKVVTKNENWKNGDGNNNTTEEFKDKEGKVVLKRTYNGSTAHDTYYVYDIYGNLTYVLPPLVDLTKTVTPAILDGLCYQYKYDYRNRLAAKKIPGKQWEFIVYDKLDRVVATGPVFSPFSDESGVQGWMITKYDAFNRVIYTGWHAGKVFSFERIAKQTAQNNATTLNETKTAAAALLDGVNVQYTNAVAPTDFKLLTVNYFDDYNYPDAPATFTNVEGQPVFYNTTTKPKGLPTGAWIRVAQTTAANVYEKSYTLYDYKVRPISSKITNFLGGYTQTDTKLDFMGKTLYTITKHKRDSNTAELLIKDEFTYTDQDRLLTQTHQINSLAKQLIVSNTYDELGKLTSKKVGGTDVTGSIGLQKVDYAYNIRGWLTDINNTEKLSLGVDPDDLFAFKINYNTPAEAAALFNGNISETYWRTKSDYQLRKYNYSYDHLNRLLKANYVKPDTGPAQILGSFDEQLGYDKNGNIRYLLRTGNFDDRSVNLIIDNLDYSYKPNSPNQLLAVEDGTNEPAGFKDNAHQQVEYSYDANGNLIADKNKNIVSIKYNHLNLPTEIIFENDGKINYLYNAVGQKVRKHVGDAVSGSNTTTDYLSGFQYQNEDLKMIPTSEGYVSILGKVEEYKPNYVFNYVDHLGNIRLSYSLEPNTKVLKIMEENHYYPFGLKHSGYNQTELEYYKISENNIVLMPAFHVSFLSNQVPEQSLSSFNYNYKYNGKELQDELGLNLYDYGARNYDAAIGRWLNIDPLAENSRRWTAYNYAYNNPIFFIDPDGMQSVKSIQEMWDATPADGSSTWTNNNDGSFSDDNEEKGEEEEDCCPGMERNLDRMIVTRQAEKKGENLVQALEDYGIGMRDKEWGEAVLIAAKEAAIYFASGWVIKAIFRGGRYVYLAYRAKNASKSFNAISFADEIVAINKATNGGGNLVNGTPSSAINSAMYYETAAEQGASIFRSISQNHMFLNGNKRTAVAAFESFASQHGLKTVSHQQMLDIATKVATGQIKDVAQIAKLLIR